MRWITVILVLLGIGCWAAYRLDLPSKVTIAPATETTWRHTAAGWEKTTGEIPSLQNFKNALNASPHPLIVALFVALLSLLILVACAPERAAKRAADPRPSRLPAGQLSLRSREWFEQANALADSVPSDSSQVQS